MRKDLNRYMNHLKDVVDKALINYLYRLDIPERLKNSMIYSVEAGGKRFRPILLLSAYDVYAKDFEKALSAACAVEFMHTYSLIHDDLPAMDDDDYRRGKPTNHRQFDEATAILAGDGLLTYCFEIILEDPLLSVEEKAKIARLLSECGGPKGMVAGQMLDMEAEKKQVNLAELEKIHALKTGELLRFSVLAGALLGGATKQQLTQLEQFAYYLGLLFQVQDDILDITGDEEKLGKPVGSDAENEKSTYPKLLGLDGAIKKKEEYLSKAKEALVNADADASYLMELTTFVSSREN